MGAMPWNSLANFLTLKKSCLPHPVWQGSPASEPHTGTRPCIKYTVYKNLDLS